MSYGGKIVSLGVFLLYISMWSIDGKVNQVNIKPRLKILVVLGNQFPVTSHTFILNQIKGLIDRGHNVTLYTNKLIHDRDDQGFFRFVKEYNLRKKIKVGSTPKDLNGYDIILCQFGTLGTRFAKIKRSMKFKGKLVTCFRGADLSSNVRRNLFSYEPLIEYGDYFLPVCDYFKKRLIFLGFEPSKIGVMYSGVDLKKFTYQSRTFPEKGPINITSVSRLVSKKGIEDAIYAVVYVHKFFPKIRYNIIGGGYEQHYLQGLVKRLKAQDYITFLGKLPHDAVCKELTKTHIFVLPSRTSLDGDQEGIPNSVKEAMLCGIPVLTTTHSGIPELVEDGVNGYMVQERCPEQLAQKLIEILQVPDQWKTIGLAAHNKVKEMFDTEQLCDQLETSLIKLVHQKSLCDFRIRCAYGYGASKHENKDQKVLYKQHE